MSIQRTSTSFPPSPPQWKYDVFLSFRGEDTRKAFTDHLYAALEHQGIITFRDDPELQKGCFREAFINHEERFRDDKEKVRRWRYALTEVATFSGWNSKEWYESKLIRDIVEVIWTKLQPTAFSYAENLVGIYSRLQPVNLLLGVGVDDVRFIGIWGMGGIGKTTIVRAVYERISREFEFSYLLMDVRSSVEKSDLLNLQKQLLSGILTKQANISDLHEGATIIRRLLGQKKVLLILDNVNHSSHLKYLAGNQEWFGRGSRVIITTRNEHLLIEHGVERRLKVEELNHDDSLQLFSWKAFKRVYPEEDFLDLSEYVIDYAKGLPLALEVLGSFLYGRDLSEWNSALTKLGRVCNLEIFDILKVSYDGLDDEEKKIFLDISCFFCGENKDRVTEVLMSCDVSAIIGLKVLTERSLLTVSHGRLWMHDLLQEMGWEIVRRESTDEPGKRSRLWLPEDIKHVLTKNNGTEAIEGIFMDLTESEVKVDVNRKSFSMMNKLRYLKINNGNLPKGLESLPNSLRLLDWTRYPLKSLPSHFDPQKLLELSLCHSCIKHVRIGTEPLYNLQTINLSHSLNLVSTPKFKGMPYLEFIVLEGCIRLYKVDPGIEVLERLIVLNLKDCKNLVRLPSSVSGLKSLEDLNLSGCSKLEKLPDELGHLACLETLDVSGSGIREVPSSIGLLKNLKELSLHGCKAQSPKSWNMVFNPFQLLQKRSHIRAGLSLHCLSGLHSLTKLDLSDCNLSEEAMPSDFGYLSSLRELNLSRNQFVRLPGSIGQLSRLETLLLNQCRKLRILPELPSYVWVDASNCISLDTLANQNGQYNSMLEGTFVNCFKMVENESCGSIALSLLTRYLKFQHWGSSVHSTRNFSFIGPGNEIPEWYNHQSVGSSVTVELHPGWFSNKWTGFTFYVVFRLLNPLPPLVKMAIMCSWTANGQSLSSFGLGFGEEWGLPVLDHTWFTFLPRVGFFEEWQDIYYQLLISFHFCHVDAAIINEEILQVKNCGVRMVYEEDVEELWQTLMKQNNTRRGLQHCDNDDDDAASSSASRAHPNRFKPLHLEGQDLV
ncbi:TMV resistance protein N isoform X2 [Rosa chinensis]|uniref:TMV resistance protein N isoform X2 n=1 Tax=Rosa chinensis TaxID=74649 RepID=UPI000D08ECC7|nr:TMV resistance protein N isoform X2 [Rosa chinensis]